MSASSAEQGPDKWGVIASDYEKAFEGLGLLVDNATSEQLAALVQAAAGATRASS
jgi:hypothetical protein